MWDEAGGTAAQIRGQDGGSRILDHALRMDAFCRQPRTRLIRTQDMFAVGDILVSDDVVDAPFRCDLAACRGGCCVQGDSGAPLEHEECDWIDSILPAVSPLLSESSRRVIDEDGGWERARDGRFVTTCVDGAECVFVVFESGIAKCGIQKAWFEGRVDRPKPLSCHLYPIRVSSNGDSEVLNYERIDLCDPARECGRREGIDVAHFLREPLVRKYGESWYEDFCEAVDDRSRHRGRSIA